MRRATITIPDGLDEELERFRLSQPAPPSLTAVIQAALERYLMKGESKAVPTLLARVLQHRTEIRHVVADHGGSNPQLFGSVARGEEETESDIDLLIDLAPGRTLFDLAAMRSELEDLLDAPVDVVARGGLDADAQAELVGDALAL